jgi:hypothetical protein
LPGIRSGFFDFFSFGEFEVQSEGTTYGKLAHNTKPSAHRFGDSLGQG